MRTIIVALLLSCPLFAQMSPTYRMTKRYSVRELEAWLKENVRPRFINPSTFNIGTQITTGWTNIHNSSDGQSQVGFSTGRASNKYNVKVNMDFTYAYGAAWASARTSYSNTAGLFGGTANSFSLARAYLGYHITTKGPIILDATIGRRALTKLYNSQMQFSGHGDGAALIFSAMPKEIVDLRATAGVFYSEARPYWLFRAGFFNLTKFGFYFDYNFAHWGKNIPLDASNGINYSFNVSQFLVGFEFKPSILNRDIIGFAALLVNHSAEITELSHGSREAQGGYVGLQYGNVKRQNDFSIQGQLQYCQLQAIPPYTQNGIGTGQRGPSIFDATSSQTVNGDTNYKGYQISGNYAVTNDLTLTAQVKRSVPSNKHIGPGYNFTSFKLESQFTF